MADSNTFSQFVTVFHERQVPEPGYLAGYAALIAYYRLAVPLPEKLALINEKNKQYHTEEWIVLTPRHKPEESLLGNLTFALKYEGIDLLVIKRLFQKIGSDMLTATLTQEITGQYARKIWFLYEWLMDEMLPIEDLSAGNYITLLNEELQFGAASVVSKRHRIRNNLPGVRSFCPLIRRTPTLEKFIGQDFSGKIKSIIGKIHPDVMARTAAFLLLKDSKASYAIEGENPPQNRAQRWGRAIGQAGLNPISKEELIRLQQVVIDNPRFLKIGFREQEGFIGEHDRRDGTPIPEHISAHMKDVQSLMDGLIETENKLEQTQNFDAVLAASLIAFGFVFIHPFVDGNGRVHRYLIHHVLLRKNYVPKGIIFPVSAIILDRLDDYRRVLESYSKPRLDLIEWKSTPDNNVEILNDTADFYRYFDATKQAEFLADCVRQTIEKTIPEEVAYLGKYDLMKVFLDEHFEMPDKTIALLIRFLHQGSGKFSQRALQNEFKALSPQEAEVIEKKYQEVFI